MAKKKTTRKKDHDHRGMIEPVEFDSSGFAEIGEAIDWGDTLLYDGDPAEFARDAEAIRRIAADWLAFNKLVAFYPTDPEDELTQRFYRASGLLMNAARVVGVNAETLGRIVADFNSLDHGEGLAAFDAARPAVYTMASFYPVDSGISRDDAAAMANTNIAAELAKMREQIAAQFAGPGVDGDTAAIPKEIKPIKIGELAGKLGMSSKTFSRRTGDAIARGRGQHNKPLSDAELKAAYLCDGWKEPEKKTLKLLLIEYGLLSPDGEKLQARRRV